MIKFGFFLNQKDQEIFQQSDFTKTWKESALAQSLESLLKVFEIFRSDIGYTQGMGSLAFLIFQMNHNIFESFTIFVNCLLKNKLLLIFYNMDMVNIEKITYVI